MDQSRREARLDVTILPGSEVRIVAGLDAAWRAGELQSIDDGPWLLLELPLHDEWPLPPNSIADTNIAGGPGKTRTGRAPSIAVANTSAGPRPTTGFAAIDDFNALQVIEKSLHIRH